MLGWNDEPGLYFKLFELLVPISSIAFLDQEFASELIKCRACDMDSTKSFSQILQKMETCSVHSFLLIGNKIIVG